MLSLAVSGAAGKTALRYPRKLSLFWIYGGEKSNRRHYVNAFLVLTLEKRDTQQRRHVEAIDDRFEGELAVVGPLNYFAVRCYELC